MLRRLPALTLLSSLLLASCARPPANAVEDPGGTQDLSTFALTSLKGTRDGDRVGVRAVYSDGPRSLTLNLQFSINPQARLESGTWTGFAGAGAVRERSITFLGGQSGPPSIGGRFDLIAPNDQTLYRVTIPLQQLKDPL